MTGSVIHVGEAADIRFLLPLHFYKKRAYGNFLLLKRPKLLEMKLSHIRFSAERKYAFFKRDSGIFF